MNLPKKFLEGIFVSSILLSTSSALEVNLTPELPYVDIEFEGKTTRIERIQDKNNKLKNSYTKTSRPCPPFCIQKIEPIKGVKSISELDVVNFLKNQVADNEGLLIDARLPQWYIQGTIPGALNVPFSVLSKSLGGQYIDQMLELFGAEKSGGKWDFSDALELLIFDNGPWCQQAVAAMKNLIKLGYPTSKIKYYRGGMQYWQILGIKTVKPNK
ncbi:MAG TPA: rhodanese-like domain-containing protein [Campylobacterales bacterium]|nr:rhodanese-like domain-containing protein [Campylobacterales bacterium]